MPLFKHVVDAFVASREWDPATLSRLAFWLEVFPDSELTAITLDGIDAALVRLAERGRLQGGKRATATTGKPLAGPTLNRYLSQLGSLFKYARRMRLVPRTFVPPTRGIEREAERPDPDRYLRPEQVERAIAVARVLDTRWGRMSALITLAHHTGLRVGSLMRVRGKDLDLAEGTMTVNVTKNGDPHVAALSTAAIIELKRLPKVAPDELVFGNRAGKPFAYDGLWERIAREAGLGGRNFHQLRHGHGYLLAKKGVSQQLIMKSMGHRTLAASQRYAHASVADKKDIIARVFG